MSDNQRGYNELGQWDWVAGCSSRQAGRQPLRNTDQLASRIGDGRVMKNLEIIPHDTAVLKWLRYFVLHTD